MERLHSRATFVQKYISTALFGSFGLLLLWTFAVSKMWVGFVITCMGLVVIIGIFRNYYWNLKRIYLDKANRKLMIKEYRRDLVISLDDVRHVELIRILSWIAVIYLKVEVEGETTFNFIPKGFAIFKSSVVQRLKSLIN